MIQNMRWSYPFQPLLLIVLDWLMVVGAEELAYALRQSWLPIANPQFHIPGFYLYLLVPAIFLAFLQSSNATLRRFPTWKMAQIVFRAVCFSLLTIALLMYFGKVGAVVSRLFVVMTGGFSFIFIVSARFFLREFLNHYHLMEIPVLFVGAGETAAELIKTLEAQGGCGMKVVGFISDTPMATGLVGRYRLLGHMEHLERVLHMTGIQHVIVTATGLPSAEQVHIINRIQPFVKNVIFVPDLLGAPVSNMEIDGLLDNSLMLLRFRNNLAHWYNRAGKRVFDLVLSFLGLVIVIPVTAAIAILIRLDSPGPIFFAHRRIGQGGREFSCYKFRTMVPNAENILNGYLEVHPEAREEWERDFKLKHAREFLEEGNKVKAYVFFRGRSIIFKDQGEVLLLRFANDLEDVGKVEHMPELLGKRMTMFIAPKKVPTAKKTQVKTVAEAPKKAVDQESAHKSKQKEYKIPTIEGE